jgi:hypothetical protein
MASIGDTTRPAFAYDQATDTWVPVGIGPHSHTASGVGAVATSSFAAKGDLVAGTGAGTLSNLVVGANNTVLTADSTTATGLKWAAPAGGGANWTLLNTGGTALTGASTITVSGISGKDKIMVIVDNASGTSAECNVSIQFNTDTASNYYRYGYYNYYDATPSFNKLSGASTSIVLGKTSTDAATQVAGYCLITGANSSGVKVFNSIGQGQAGSGSDHTGYGLGGYYNSSSTISSVSIVGTSNFDNGTVFVYTSA